MIERFFSRLGVFIVNKRRVIIIVGLVLLFASLFGVMRINMATGIETWVSTDSQTYKDYERFNQHFGSNVIVIMVTGDDINQLLQPDNLKTMENIENQIGLNTKVISAISPAFLIKQAATEYIGVPVLPDDPQIIRAIVLDNQSGQIRPEFRDVLPDDKHALIPIVLKGGMSRDEEKEVVEEAQNMVDTADFIEVEAVVTGGPAVTSQIQDLMANSMRNMFIVAIFLMFVILAVIFRVRGFFAWRWLPMGEVAIAIIYTFGAMGILSVPITMVTMAVFPVLIGLGVDYSIQLHNRYDEETGSGKTVANAIKESVTHIGPAMGIALIAMCLGFAAMLFSPVPMIGDFGLMLIIGVIICYVVAMLLPLTILYWRDRRAALITPHDKKKSMRKKEKIKLSGDRMGFVERGLQRLIPWVIKNPAIIIPIAIALSIAGLVSDPHIKTETDWNNLFAEDVEVVKDFQTLQSVAPGTTSTNVLVEAADVSRPEVMAWMVEVEDLVWEQLGSYVADTNCIAALVLQANDGEMPQSHADVQHCIAELPAPLKKNLVNEDYTAANIVINLKGEDVERMGQIERLKTRLTDYTIDGPSGVGITLTGAALINMELFDALTSGRQKVTLIGIGLIFLGLFLLFRLSLLKSLIAILPIALIIGWSSGLMYLLGITFNPLTATLGVLILSIGVEYTILLMTRYYEERDKGKGPEEAMTTAALKIGRAIVVSGLTDIGGFTALLAAGGFLMLRDFGVMTVINISLALVSTLVVLPALIVSIDSWRERRRLVKGFK
jgi:hydrophobe/amphiphile efflux-3 (HAE3) family protein